MAFRPPSALRRLVSDKRDLFKPPTTIEFLKIFSNAPESAAPVEYLKLGDDILDNINDASVSHPEGPITQILFLSSVRDHADCTTNQLRITDATLEALCFQLNIPLAFLEAVLEPNIWANQSGSSFHRWKDMQLESIDGFYHFFHEWDLGSLHVWFSYHIKTGSITYVLIDCPSKVKTSILTNINEGAGHVIHQPLEIDILIAEECASWREGFINKHYKKIFDWHEKSGKMDPPLKPGVSNPKSLQDLHNLSRTWNMLYEDLGDLSGRLEFLVAVAHKLSAASFFTSSFSFSSPTFSPSAIPSTYPSSQAQIPTRALPITSSTPPYSLPSTTTSSSSTQPPPPPAPLTLPTPNPSHAAIESLTHLLTRTNLRRRWVTSFSARTNLITSFVFGITNTRTSNLTQQIASDAQRDNSNMITIATLTMVFLPATAISAIFSMVFFNLTVDEHNNEVFTVSGRLWVYFAVTVPLTAVVLAVYFGWRKWRKWRERRLTLRWRGGEGEGDEEALVGMGETLDVDELRLRMMENGVGGSDGADGGGNGGKRVDWAEGDGDGEVFEMADRHGTKL